MATDSAVVAERQEGKILGGIPTDSADVLITALENISFDSLFTIISVDGETPDSILRSNFTEQVFLNTQAGCSSGILLELEWVNSHHETYVQFFWLTYERGEWSSSSVIYATETTSYDSDTFVSLDESYGFSQNCKVWCIRESKSWGQIEGYDQTTLRFYAISDGVYVQKILEVIEQYRVSTPIYEEGEEVASKSETELEERTIRVLAERENGFPKLQLAIKMTKEMTNEETEETTSTETYIFSNLEKSYSKVEASNH